MIRERLLPAGSRRDRDAALAVECITGRDRFEALCGEWNALVEAAGEAPFLRHEFIASWLASFAPEAPLRLLAARRSDGVLAALLPLVERRDRIAGFPVREWSSPTDVHSARFDLVALDPVAAARAFLARLRAERGWSALRLADVPEGGAAQTLFEEARRAGLPGGRYRAQQSPVLFLPATVAALRAGWGTKWRSNLARRRRILERHGVVAFRRLDASDPDLARQLELAFAIEAAGWKGRRGQPVDSDPRQRAFYLALARPAAAGGAPGFALDLLELDGRMIAFHYGIERGGAYSLLLTGHDERYRDGAPGHLLTERLAERSIERGLAELDFLGCDLEWKRAWTDRVRPHDWLWLFRDTRAGALLARLKFDWAPALRRRLARRARGEAVGGGAR